MANEVFQVKVVKPKKMKVGPMRNAIVSAVGSEAKWARDQMKRTISGWQGVKPVIDMDASVKGGDLSYLVAPSGPAKGVQKWNWLDQGTRPHRITAKRAKTLRFQVNYAAGTSPGSLDSYPGGSWGATRYPRSVWHPGFPARGWTEMIYKKGTPRFQKAVIAATKTGAHKFY